MWSKDTCQCRKVH
ncbi:hypothetical protein DWZ62_08890 [Ruminococcus sp. AF34-12]|nr:hypothetical protein DWZ62_08890 [Ruminococcus sp. AF34-12]